MITTLLIAQSVGLFVGAAVMEPKTAQAITSVAVLTVMLVRPGARFRPDHGVQRVAGVIYSGHAAQSFLVFQTVECFAQVGGYYISTIPGWIGWLKYMSFIYYAFNLLLKVKLAAKLFRRYK